MTQDAITILGRKSPPKPPLEYHEIELLGCSLIPMSNYFKALGILKILPELEGCWKEGKFHLKSPYPRSELISKIIEKYVASPICTPWNGYCGLYKEMPPRLSSLLAYKSERFRLLKKVYELSQKAIQEEGLKSQPTGKKKIEFVKKITSLGNDINQWNSWLDLVAIIVQIENKKGKLEDKPIYPGITGGTGGTVGNKDLGAVYLEALECIFDLNTGKPLSQAEVFLESSLFGTSLEGSLIPATLLTQFSPVNDFYQDISGAKAHSEYAESGGGSTSMCNPIDVILLFEGLMSLSGISARKINQRDGDRRTQANFSLAVDLAGGTSDITTENDTSRRLEEIWLPVLNEPLSCNKLKRTLGEMSNRLPNQQISDSIDFAHKISLLGKEEGFLSYVRYSFLPRKGKANFAIYLGSVSLVNNSLVNDLASQLRTFRRACYVFANGKYSTTIIRTIIRQLDKELLQLAQGRESYLQCLILLGKLVTEISTSSIMDASVSEFIPIPPLLSSKWLDTILREEQSTECRLGISLASLSFRQRATKLAFSQKKNKFYWDKERTPTWGRGDLCRNLVDLQRQWKIYLSQGIQPFSKSFVCPRFEDLTAFIEGRVDEQEIEQIARGASLCQQVGRVFDKSFQTGFLPPHYSLTAISHWSRDEGDKPVLGGIQIVNLLARKESKRAMALAIRTLRAKTLFPLLTNPFLHPQGEKIAAALAFPLSKKQLNSLNHYHLK